MTFIRRTAFGLTFMLAAGLTSGCLSQSSAPTVIGLSGLQAAHPAIANKLAVAPGTTALPVPIVSTTTSAIPTTSAVPTTSAIPTNTDRGPTVRPTGGPTAPTSAAPTSTAPTRAQVAPTSGSASGQASGSRPGSISTPGDAAEDGCPSSDLPSSGAATSAGAAALPSVEASRKVDIVLSPHPDDETLSMGVWIAQRAMRGHRVIVVMLTDGCTTGAAQNIAARLGHPVDYRTISTARILEMRAAGTQLGVRPDDVYLAHLDGDATPGGRQVTAPEISKVIDTFAARYPGAQFITMSNVAEHHPDHLAAGNALYAAWSEHRVSKALFAVSRLYWWLPLPGEYRYDPPNRATRERVQAAAAEYGVWAPAEGRLAVGRTSVQRQFKACIASPANVLHRPLSAAGHPTVRPTTGTLPR